MNFVAGGTYKFTLARWPEESGLALGAVTTDARPGTVSTDERLQGKAMKFVIQRVKKASVKVDDEYTGKIKKGYLVLIGVGQEDTKEEADKYIRKMINLRIFEDENGKTNCSLKDVDGELLLVSQFTLYASCRKGNRPSFTQAGDPKKAEELYEYIIKECNKEIDVVQTGIFGAHMEVALINDGPFTVVLEDL